MTYDSFKHYLIKSGFEHNYTNIRRFFGAVNLKGNGFASLTETILGLICMERDTPQVEFRIHFVFNYYDTKKREALYEEDFIKMAKDMLSDKHSQADITKKVCTGGLS